MLVASGKFDPARARGSPAMDFKVVEMTDRSPHAKTLQEAADKSVQRSIYLPLLRGLTPRTLEVFDFAEQGMVTGSRDSTTVATQALYLLNDPFVRQQALALAERLLGRADMRDTGRLLLAYRLTMGRMPTARETERAMNYLVEFEAEARADAESRLEQGNNPRNAAWASFCQALMASAEFRFVR